MQKRELGTSNIQVSVICLGTMTFGQQNTEKQAHEQLDIATDNGINFIDTAEIYPSPIDKTKQGAQPPNHLYQKYFWRSAARNTVRDRQFARPNRGIHYRIDLYQLC